MEYPLGDRNRDYAHKGIFKKMLTEFLGGKKKSIMQPLEIHCGNLLLTCHHWVQMTLGISRIWMPGKRECNPNEWVDDNVQKDTWKALAFKLTKRTPGVPGVHKNYPSDLNTLKKIKFINQLWKK